MVIFNSYVKLPEGTDHGPMKLRLWEVEPWFNDGIYHGIFHEISIVNGQFMIVNGLCKPSREFKTPRKLFVFRLRGPYQNYAKVCGCSYGFPQELQDAVGLHILSQRKSGEMDEVSTG